MFAYCAFEHSLGDIIIFNRSHDGNHRNRQTLHLISESPLKSLYDTMYIRSFILHIGVNKAGKKQAHSPFSELFHNHVI